MIVASESWVAPGQTWPHSSPSSSSRSNRCPILPARQDSAFHPRSILQETYSVQEQLGRDRSVPLVERLAVQRRGRRTSGSLMLLQFPCGDCVRCNGLFDGSSLSDDLYLDSQKRVGWNHALDSLLPIRKVRGNLQPPNASHAHTVHTIEQSCKHALAVDP